ncbi:MAG: ATP-binding protein [Nitrospiraceae bacterium]
MISKNPLSALTLWALQKYRRALQGRQPNGTPAGPSSEAAESSSDRRQAWRRHEDQQLLQRERELEAAQRISEALFQRTDIDEMVEMALRATVEVLEADGGSVLLADPEKKQLVFKHSMGPKPVPCGTAMPWDQGFAGAVFQSGKPEIVADAKLDTRHYTRIDELTGFVSHDMIVFPLKRWEGKPIGVLEVLNKRDGQLQIDAFSILTIISAFTASAIEQARLFHEAKLAEVVGLMGDVCHDVKNMLMPVLCGAGLLKEEIREVFDELIPSGSERARKSRALCDEVIDILHDDAKRINDRMREIADCVKGLSAPPQFAPCQAADVVETVFKTLRMLAQDKQVDLRTEGLDALPIIQADERRLYNVFYNLVNNAIPEVPPGGSVTIRGQAHPASQEVLFAVADTGRGMSPEVRDSLFTAGAISRKAGGTGLGTKIIKDVVDAHRGRITVESQEGRGTTFLIRLPLRPPVATSSLSH